VVPDDWTGFRATRRFRGVDYDIDVRRRGPGTNVSLRVDGSPVDGWVIPLPAAGTATVKVEALLG
jgi:cellobiose phosphorylase